jgi:hypothetical protein
MEKAIILNPTTKWFGSRVEEIFRENNIFFHGDNFKKIFEEEKKRKILFSSFIYFKGLILPERMNSSEIEAQINSTPMESIYFWLILHKITKLKFAKKKKIYIFRVNFTQNNIRDVYIRPLGRGWYIGTRKPDNNKDWLKGSIFIYL